MVQLAVTSEPYVIWTNIYSWWKNFEDTIEDEFNHLANTHRYRDWTEMINEALVIHNGTYAYPYINFNTEEDMVNFLIKFS